MQTILGARWTRLETFRYRTVTTCRGLTAQTESVVARRWLRRAARPPYTRIRWSIGTRSKRQVNRSEFDGTRRGPVSPDTAAERQRRRLRLRVRTAVAFALTAAILSACLAVLAYALVRRAALEERESQAMRQTYTNARFIRNGLRDPEPNIPRLLTSLQASPRGGAMVRHRGQWYSSSVELRREVLPAPLVETVAEGHAARQTVDRAGAPALAAGVALVEADALYFEVFPLVDLEETLGVLARSLFIAGVIATVIGGAVGASVSGAVLRPVLSMARLSQEIVLGGGHRRLDADGDPDLEPLVQSFNQTLDALQERIRREARFASDVTHELRGPLAALSSAVDVVDRRRDQLPEQAIVAIDALASQVRSFNQLVLDLLEISRFDAGAAQIDWQPLDVGESLRAMCAELAPGARVSIETSDPVLMADPRRLRQVVANLLQNADFYAGGVTDVVVADRGPSLRMEFGDRGPGIPEHERQTIFGRFARGGASESPEAPRGSGLGLALVAEHVTLHGGRVWVEGRDGGGALFVVEIPRRDR